MATVTHHFRLVTSFFQRHQVVYPGLNPIDCKYLDRLPTLLSAIFYKKKNNYFSDVDFLIILDINNLRAMAKSQGSLTNLLCSIKPAYQNFTIW